MRTHQLDHDKTRRCGLARRIQDFAESLVDAVSIVLAVGAYILGGVPRRNPFEHREEE